MGIVLAGLGNYSTRELLPAIKESQHLKLVGVVTGSADKGVAWAREHGFPERNVWGYPEFPPRRAFDRRTARGKARNLREADGHLRRGVRSDDGGGHRG